MKPATLFGCKAHKILDISKPGVIYSTVRALAVGSSTSASSHAESAQLSEHILIIGFIKKATTSSSTPAPLCERAKSAVMGHNIQESIFDSKEHEPVKNKYASDDVWVGL